MSMRAMAPRLRPGRQKEKDRHAHVFLSLLINFKMTPPPTNGDRQRDQPRRGTRQPARGGLAVIDVILAAVFRVFQTLL